MLKIGCTASESKIDAINTKNNLINKFSFYDLDKNPNEIVDIVIMLGGDGFALHAIHRFVHLNARFYGLNYGTLGFLMNKKELADMDNFYDLITKNTSEFIVKPLSIIAKDVKGNTFKEIAINDVSLIRNTSQAAKIKIYVDDVLRMSELAADGVLVSTPIGSTAYNVSVNGPILPINSNLLAITPISPFRPRYWRGAMIDHNSKITLEVTSPLTRSVSLNADFMSINDIEQVQICLAKDLDIKILFDNNFGLSERIMREQFMVYN